jgi:hypothetical protein
MKKVIHLIVFSLLLTSAYGQNLDSLQRKFAAKICTCVGELEKYEQLKPVLDKCYDKTMNFIFNDATPEEVKFYGVPGNLQLLNQNLEQNLKTQCPAIKKLVEESVKPGKKGNSYPVNFNSRQLEEAKKDLKSWDGKIVAFDGEIIEVNFLGPNRPYLKVKLDDQVVWVGSMVNSKFETVGNRIRFLGYFSLTKSGDPGGDLNKSGFHILAFGVIELKSMELAMFPGSEVQVREWANGKVPKAGK